MCYTLYISVSKFCALAFVRIRARLYMISRAQNRKNSFQNSHVSANWIWRKLNVTYCSNWDEMVCVFCFQNEFPTLEIPHSKFKKAAISKIFFLFCTPSCITLGRTIFQKLLHWSYFANFPNIAWIAWFPNRTASTGQPAFCTVWPEKNLCISFRLPPPKKFL